MVKVVKFRYSEKATKFLNFLTFLTKGQLISKCLFGIFNSPKTKRRKKFDFITMIPVTSSQIVFVRFLEELKTPKRLFEIK